MTLEISTVVKLNNGIDIPIFGLGTYLATGDATIKAVHWALEAGYRHIDTAKLYGNEREIGAAVKKSGIPREEIFVTTKLWNADHGYDEAIRAFNASLKRLDMDYVDLYLIHWPVEGLRGESWRALEKLYEEGKCKSIGVSNYMIHHLEELLGECEVAPAVNQCEFHPYLYLKDLLDYCNSKDIKLESYSPLTKGKKLNDPKLKAMGDKYGRSPAQILIRWVLQKDVIVIPKSSNKDRIYENASVFDFNISDEDMRNLDSFHMELHTSWDPTGTP